MRNRLPSFRASLRAPRTAKTYAHIVGQFLGFIERRDLEPSRPTYRIVVASIACRSSLEMASMSGPSTTRPRDRRDFGCSGDVSRDLFARCRVSISARRHRPSSVRIDSANLAVR
jgi:hypothetical protein